MAISPTFSANYAILQLCRVAANHVAQFSNGSCRFRASDFCNENLGDYFCNYPPPFAWPFMQKLRASRARVWFEHKTSGLLHKFRIEWTRCNFGGRRPWFICQCGKRVAKLYDTGSIVACRHCLDTIYESQRRGENGRKYLRACRIRLSIGGAPTISRDFPERPWRMHRKNYERTRIKAEKIRRTAAHKPAFQGSRAGLYVSLLPVIRFAVFLII